MDIAVIGAGGVIGRQIVISLIEQRLLPPTGRLQLVGRAGGASERLLYGLACDLEDAYAEILPEIDIALRPEQVVADVHIMAAGRTVGTGPDDPPDRRALTRANLSVFESYAKQLAETAHGEELVLVVTNPVELGVHVYARYYQANRVIGMGAYLDTMRFRAEIAHELGIRRQNVYGYVLGEHGFGMVPCWSTVGAYGFSTEEGRRKIQALQYAGPEMHEAIAEVLQLLADQGPVAAYARCREYPADLRTLVNPLITHCTGQRTPVGTASTIVRLVDILLSGSQVSCAAQASLDGSYLDICGVTGVPMVLSRHGIERFEPLALNDSEIRGIRQAAHAFEQLRQEVFG